MVRSSRYSPYQRRRLQGNTNRRTATRKHYSSVSNWTLLTSRVVKGSGKYRSCEDRLGSPEQSREAEVRRCAVIDTDQSQASTAGSCEIAEDTSIEPRIVLSRTLCAEEQESLTGATASQAVAEWCCSDDLVTRLVRFVHSFISLKLLNVNTIYRTTIKVHRRTFTRQ